MDFSGESSITYTVMEKCNILLPAVNLNGISSSTTFYLALIIGTPYLVLMNDAGFE